MGVLTINFECHLNIFIQFLGTSLVEKVTESFVFVTIEIDLKP